MNECYVLEAGSNFHPEQENNVMTSIFEEYERVIVESIMTSFGLDFLVKDQYGGDVDTIHNVRKIGKNDQMTYKNQANQKDYENKEKYNSGAYHRGTNYQTTKKEARDNYRQNNQTVEDAYTGGELGFLGKSKGANPKKNAELDHVISAKSIDEDRGRVLAGVDGKDLANSPENLKFTNKSLNASMQDKEIPTYIENHPELPPEQKEKMMKHYNKSKLMYEDKLAKEYYTSKKFRKDVAFAAGSVGVKMGFRQALGFVFTEVWFTLKEEFENINGHFDLGELLFAIAKGIERGIKNAKEKYKELLSKFKEGVVAGALSSLTTTLCNIFFTTAKSVSKIIRQSWASLVQAAKVLFINPDNLEFGERMRAAVKIIATGASVVVGGLVFEQIGKSPIGGIEKIGDIVQTFCGTLVTGIMSCSFLYFFDRSEIMNKLVSKLNNIHTLSTEVNYFRRQAEYFERYAAELMCIDVEKFRKETAVYASVAGQIENAKSETELNAILESVMKIMGIKIPWKGDFDSFMNDGNAVLVFE